MREIGPQRPALSGLGAVGSAVTLMGIGSVVAKAAAVEGPVLGFHRAWIAAVLYGVILLSVGGRPSLAKLRIAAPGGLCLGLEFAFFFSSIRLTTVANATMMIALQPVLVLMFFSRRFGETVTAREWVLSALAVAGVAGVIFGSVDSPSWSPLGDLLAVGATIMWTLYFVESKKAREHLGVIEYQALSLVFSALMVLPIVVVVSGTLEPGPGKWGWILAMVAIPGTGHFILNWAHPRVPLGLVSQLTLVSPVVSVALAALVLDGERVNVVQVAGMAVVLGALGVLVRTR